jgi:anaerobic magnesium-protoporphyrin IX monomethyl ester cyclase
LSLLALAAPLDKKGYDIEIIDANIEDEYIEKALVRTDDALCIGISCMTGPQIKGALKMARAVKDKRPDLPVVIGGWHATILPEQTLENELVDVVVKGQGEDIFEEIVENLKHNKPLDSIKGIGYKKDGAIILNDKNSIKNINDTYPMPYHLLSDIEKYVYSDWYGNRIISYISSFGCPHNCGFCAEHNMSLGRWNGLAAERVASEINALAEQYKLDGIGFHDSNFFVDENRVRELCKGLKQGIRWGNANGSARILLKYSPDTWSLMKKAGCSEILIGAESGDDEILKFISKGVRVEDMIKLKELSHRHNIRLWISLMIGIPFDLENPKKAFECEFRSCTKLVQRLYKIDNTDKYAIFIYTPYPGTKLYDYSIKNGVKTSEDLEGWSNFSLNSVNVPWVGKNQITSADFLSNFIFVHSRPPLHKGLEFIKQPFIKKIYMNVCYRIASFRIRYNFYNMKFEYLLIRFLKSVTNITKK